MRAALLLILLAGVPNCGRNEAEGSQGSAAKSAADLAREQADFDRDRRPDKVLEALAIGPGSRVADIGAGTGLMSVHLARAVGPTGRVVATDVNPEVFDFLKARLAATGLTERVESRVVPGDTPGLEAGAYDAILLAEVDHFFTDEVAWLTTATAALKPGGRIVISNRIHHRARSMAAAQKAGLVLKSESSPVPTQFIAVFTAHTAPADKDKK